MKVVLKYLSIAAIEKENTRAHKLSWPDLDQRQRSSLQDCFKLLEETVDDLNSAYPVF